MSDGLDDWGKRVSDGWRLTEQKQSLVERLKVRAMPIDPATEWSDHAVVTAVESSIDRQALIQWVAEQLWEWEQSSELTRHFATRVVDTLLAAFFRSGD